MWCEKTSCFYIAGILNLITSTLGDQPKIVIIGAGPAGIATASKLFENGFENVTILEAEDRIGGRIHTTSFDDGLIEIGARWVHGEENNVVFELASPLGLLEVPQVDKIISIYGSDGRQIPVSISNDFIDLWQDAYTAVHENLKGNNGSLGDYLTTRLTAGATKIPTLNQTLRSQLMKVIEGLTISNHASESWYDISARGCVEFWECPGSGSVIWKDKGYESILDILMKKYPDPENELPVLNNTKLNSEVKTIDYGSEEGKVLVALSNGEEYEADHVIVTPSLGVLKEQHETLFRPKLPESKVNTIRGLGMGTVAKMFFSFKQAWWPNSNERLVLLWNESDRQEYENDPHKQWLLDVLDFCSTPQRPLILTTWINGSGARYMETLSEDEVISQTFELLVKFLGKTYNVTGPTGFLRSKWYSNKHFRGTYSYRSMESEKADVWADGLAAPLVVNDKPIVMFAGEATHSHYYSTVHGAIETGFREADRLTNIYNNAR